MRKVLVTGASGFLGSQVYSFISTLHEVTGTCHTQKQADLISIDMTKTDEVESFVLSVKPQVVIHTVALVNVKLCDEDLKLAYDINVLTIRNLVKACLKLDETPRLIYISTDHVYDGKCSSENQVKLLNNYALTKLAGEDMVSMLPGSLSLRVNFVGLSSRKTTFMDWVLDSLRKKKTITAFSDVYFSPLDTKTISEMIVKLIDSPVVGVYNLGSRNECSKAEFIEAVAQIFSLSTDSVTVGSIKDAGLTRRPSGMGMNVSRIEGALGIQMPSVRDGIKRIFNEY